MNKENQLARLQNIKVQYAALIPGTFFGVSNYVQNGMITDWFGSIFYSAIFAASFMIVYNFYALVFFLQWRLTDESSENTPLTSLVLRHLSILLIFGVLYLTLISILVTIVRNGFTWDEKFFVYFEEIIVTCLPVWVVLYVATLSACYFFRSKPSNENLKSNLNGTANLSKFCIKENGKTQYLNVSEIHHIESQGDYVRVFTEQEKYMTKGSLNTVEKQFYDDELFVRVHRSHFVRINLITAIKRSPTGAYVAQTHIGKSIPISRRKVAFLKAKLSGVLTP